MKQNVRGGCRCSNKFSNFAVLQKGPHSIKVKNRILIIILCCLFCIAAKGQNRDSTFRQHTYLGLKGGYNYGTVSMGHTLQRINTVEGYVPGFHVFQFEYPEMNRAVYGLNQGKLQLKGKSIHLKTGQGIAGFPERRFYTLYRLDQSHGDFG